MSIPILKVKDKNGNIVPILAIKGDKGDAYTLTEADKKEIAGMAIIDQTYDPESENAQSGKAVAEAVSGKADVENWEHIETITTAEDTKYIEYTKEPDGTPYKFKKMFVKVTMPSGGNGNMYFGLMDRRNIPVIASVSYLLLTHQLGFAYYYPAGEFMMLQTNSGSGGYTQHNNFATPIKMPYVDIVRIQGNGTILAGTTFEIWGVRYK